MKRKDGISIIVPCYNVEKYIHTCVDSLLKQNIENYEIILVDDGSKDNTGKICDEYKKEKKVRVFHKKNGGLCSARNYGIDKATYTYLAFVDSDDWVTEDYLETIYNEIKEGYDVISFNLYTKFEGDDNSYERPCYTHKEQTKKNFLLYSTEPSFACSRCYHYTLFEKVKYPDPGIWYEDVATTPILLSFAQKIIHINKGLYYYRQREDSISHQLQDQRTLGILEACDRILTLGNKDFKKELEYAVYHVIANFIYFKPEYVDEFIAYINRYKQDFLHNNYILKAIEEKKEENLFELKLIPKKIHYFWFGGNPLNDLTKKCIESWKKYAPDYEIIEWNESNCDVYENDYVKEAYEHKKWAFVADYFRIKVIYEQGGFYMDTDMELKKSLDYLRLDNIFFPQETNNVNACIFGSIPKHPLLKEWLETYQNDHFVKKDGTLDMNRTIVIRLTEVLKKHYKIKYRCYNQKIAPYFTLYSPDVLLIDVFNNQNIAVHHYDATWWDVKTGTTSYKYEVLKYYFQHVDKYPLRLFARIRGKIGNGVRKMGHFILPDETYEKLKTFYHRFR